MTDRDLLQITKEISDEMKLRDVADLLPNFDKGAVSTALYNKRHDICNAAYHVFNQWFKAQEESDAAFVAMWETL